MKNLLFHSAKLILIAAFISIVSSVMAQHRPGAPKGRERLEVVKTTYLSRHIKLTPEEARLFWPVYDQYQEAMDKLRENRQEAFQNLDEGLDAMSDDEINAMIDSRLHQAEAALAARKKMIASLREFLAPRKIAIFLRAEQQFNLELQQRLRK